MGKEMKLVKRNIALGLLIMFISNLLFGGGIVVDPKTGQNVWVDQAPNGATIINISTPNGKGISVNDFKEFKTGDKGVVYINFGAGIGRSYLTGLVNANNNITGEEARIILNRVTGGNRAEIESYLEALGHNKTDLIFSSPNGIYMNGAGYIGLTM